MAFQTANLSDGWTVFGNSPELGPINTSADNPTDPNGTPQPKEGVDVAIDFTSTAPVTLTFQPGTADLKEYIDPLILNDTGLNWSGFLISAQSANMMGTSPSLDPLVDPHPMYAHFHDANLSGWVNPQTPGFTTIAGTDPNGAPTLGINKASNVNLSGGLFDNGTFESWHYFGLHEMLATGSFTLTFTPIFSQPAVTFTPGVTFKNKHTATLTGTVSDPSSAVTQVQIFDNNVSVGFAALNSDGTWTLADAHFTSGNQNLYAVATDAAGNSSPQTVPPFALQTNIHGQPYTSYEGDVDSAGNFTGETFTMGNGAVYLADKVVQTMANGDVQLDYFQGTFFNSQNYYYKSDVYSSDYSVLKTETLYNDNNTHTISAFVNGQTLTSIQDDTLTGNGRNETFDFQRHFGRDVITDFQVGGGGHDTLRLSMSDAFASSVADLLDHTHDLNGSAVIRLDGHDTITLEGVTKAELAAHHSDFKFHA